MQIQVIRVVAVFNLLVQPFFFFNKIALCAQLFEQLKNLKTDY